MCVMSIRVSAGGGVDHITLANRWQISLEKAQNTVQRTTQRGVHTVLHPTLSRRFRTNDWMLCYKRMPCNIYSNTPFCPKVPSARGYTMTQIFATDFGWSRSYPMSCKSQVHDALSLLLLGRESRRRLSLIMQRS